MHIFGAVINGSVRVLDVFIGDASQFWKKEKSSQIKCVCEDECNDNCLNRCTWMECDDESCSIGRQCQNRAFADLKERVRTGTKFAEGVEVVKVRPPVPSRTSIHSPY